MKTISTFTLYFDKPNEYTGAWVVIRDRKYKVVRWSEDKRSAEVESKSVKYP